MSQSPLSSSIPSSSAETPIEFENVFVEYGDLRVLDNVTFQIRKGSLVALIGEAGSGKTTLLRLINRLGDPTRGEVRVLGQPTSAWRPTLLRRQIGYVIQESGLFPHMTVHDNVATVPRLLGWPANQIRQHVAEVLDQVHLPLGEFGARYPDQLSGGQRQRAGVARGLAGRPQILLMDEPFGALDPTTRARVQDEFLRIHKELKTTVVMVTHDMAEAGRLADQIVLLGGASTREGEPSPWRGQLLQQGPLREILLHPNEGVRLGSSLAGGGAGGMAREALLLGCVLPLLAEVSSSDNPLPPLSSGMPLGQALVALENAQPGQKVPVAEPSSTRWYDAHALRQQIVSDLRQAEAAFASPSQPQGLAHA